MQDTPLQWYSCIAANAPAGLASFSGQARAKARQGHMIQSLSSGCSQISTRKRAVQALANLAKCIVVNAAKHAIARWRFTSEIIRRSLEVDEPAFTETTH
jgi:hypothetical protein